jgi:hypothetical protein
LHRSSCRAFFPPTRVLAVFLLPVAYESTNESNRD